MTGILCRKRKAAGSADWVELYVLSNLQGITTSIDRAEALFFQLFLFFLRPKAFFPAAEGIFSYDKSIFSGAEGIFSTTKSIFSAAGKVLQTLGASFPPDKGAPTGTKKALYRVKTTKVEEKTVEA